MIRPNAKRPPGRPGFSRRTKEAIRSRLGQSADALRRHLGLSMAAMAVELGWTVGDVARLISGEMRPSAGQHEDLDKWAKGSRAKMQRQAADCKTPYELVALATQRAKVDRESDR